MASNSQPATTGAGSYIFTFLFGLSALILYCRSFIYISKFVGQKDGWSQIRPQIIKIWGLSMTGSFLLLISSFIYFTGEPINTIYFILVISFIALALSYSALGVSAITVK